VLTLGKYAAWPNQLDLTGYESGAGSESWVRRVCYRINILGSQ